MFRAGFHDIDPRRLDAGMTKQVGQLRDIFFDVVKRPGKQVPQVVGEDLPCGYFGPLTQRLEQLPDRHAAERFAAAGQKDRAGVDAVLLAPLLQPVAEFGGQQNFPALALAADGRLAATDGLGGDELQFRHADAGGADGFEQQLGAFVAGLLGGGEQAEILSAGELAARIGKDFALSLEGLGLACRVVDGLLVVVDSSQQRVDSGRGVTFGGQAVPPGGDHLAVGALARPGVGEEASQGAGVLLDGGGTVLVVDQPMLIGLHNFLKYHTCLLSLI